MLKFVISILDTWISYLSLNKCITRTPPLPTCKTLLMFWRTVKNEDLNTKPRRYHGCRSVHRKHQMQRGSGNQSWRILSKYEVHQHSCWGQWSRTEHHISRDGTKQHLHTTAAQLCREDRLSCHLVAILCSHAWMDTELSSTLLQDSLATAYWRDRKRPETTFCKAEEVRGKEGSDARSWQILALEAEAAKKLHPIPCRTNRDDRVKECSTKEYLCYVANEM